MTVGGKGWGVRFREQIRRSWVPTALVAGGGTLALSVVQGRVGTSVVVFTAGLLGLGVSTRTDVFQGISPLPGTRTTAVTAFWAASALLFLVALGPVVVMAGPEGLSVLGLGFFLQTVYLSAGVWFPKASVWGAVAVTALTVAALSLVGMVWTGLNTAVAMGAQPPAWTDTLLWWGIAVAVPVVSLGLAWSRLGRKEPVEPVQGPDSPEPLP